MIYWVPKVAIVQHNIPKGCLLSQAEMIRYKFDLDNVAFFDKISTQRTNTIKHNKFRYLINDKAVEHLPRFYVYK